MNKLDELTIGEARVVAAMVGGTQAVPCTGREDHGIQIVVLDRGFVYIGRVQTDDGWVYITDAKNIRYWGTSKGLGELVNGPLSETKLDDTGTVKASRRALIHLIAVDEKKWKSAF